MLTPIRLFVTKTDPGTRLEAAGLPADVVVELSHLLDAGQLAGVISTLQRIHEGKCALDQAAVRRRMLESERAQKGLPPLRAYGVRELGQVESNSPEAHEHVAEQVAAAPPEMRAYLEGMPGYLPPDADDGNDALEPRHIGRTDAGHGVAGPHCTQAQGAD